MADCRECDTTIPDEANFCSSCGAPQNEEAAKALEKYARRKATELSVVENPPDTTRSSIESDSGLGLPDRLSYALGWVIVVAGLALAPHVASGFVVFGGVVALPPIRRLLGQMLGYTPEVGPMLLIAVTSVGIGLGLFFVA